MERYDYRKAVKEDVKNALYEGLFKEAEEFGIPSGNDSRKFSAEFWDVSIRCYILGNVIRDAVDEYLEEVV